MGSSGAQSRKQFVKTAEERRTFGEEFSRDIGARTDVDDMRRSARCDRLGGCCLSFVCGCRSAPTGLRAIWSPRRVVMSVNARLRGGHRRSSGRVPETQMNDGLSRRRIGAELLAGKQHRTHMQHEGYADRAEQLLAAKKEAGPAYQQSESPVFVLAPV